ncbi:hypothetical protein ABDK56_12450 [Sphingomonas sp. ASV193]|uniref:hypothetical protein n=1 Tax=Sphingomonas sp. ASV193 TaxID=3144405 RepID=UPI0032E89AF2
MRRLLLLLPFALAACSSTPGEEAPSPATPAPPPSQRGELIGLSANELAARYGAPDLQVREGDGTKLQFRSRNCVLDAYLYPPPAGVAGIARVSHVDTRDLNGNDVDQASCAASLTFR